MSIGGEKERDRQKENKRFLRFVREYFTQIKTSPLPVRNLQNLGLCANGLRAGRELHRACYRFTSVYMVHVSYPIVRFYTVIMNFYSTSTTND